MRSLYKGLLWISILIPVSSCSFTEKITSEEYDIPKIESKFRNKEATVLLTTGQQIKAKNLEFSKDSICCRTVGSNATTAFKFQDVRSITYTNRALGGLLGTLIGASVGILVAKFDGKAKAKCSGDCGTPVPILDDAADAIAEGMEQALFMGLGGGVGYLIGRNAVTHGVEYTNHADPFSDKIIELPLSAVLKEDKESIKIDYLGKEVWLYKSQIKLERKKDSIILKMKAGLYRKTFEK